jgi:hypothetical protein
MCRIFRLENCSPEGASQAPPKAEPALMRRSDIYHWLSEILWMIEDDT